MSEGYQPNEVVGRIAIGPVGGSGTGAHRPEKENAKTLGEIALQLSHIEKRLVGIEFELSRIKGEKK